MSTCSGRCRCHRHSWETLDQAAGLPHVRHPGGRKPYEQDAASFSARLDRFYWEVLLEWPGRKPSYQRVADKFKMDRRTFRSTLTRLDVAWPPPRFRELLSLAA